MACRGKKRTLHSPRACSGGGKAPLFEHPRMTEMIPGTTEMQNNLLALGEDL